MKGSYVWVNTSMMFMSYFRKSVYFGLMCVCWGEYVMFIETVEEPVYTSVCLSVCLWSVMLQSVRLNKTGAALTSLSGVFPAAVHILTAKVMVQ